MKAFLIDRERGRRHREVSIRWRPRGAEARTRPRPSLVVLLMTVLVCATACGGTTPPATLTPYPTLSGSGLGARPSTPVKITLVSPTEGQVVHGTSVLVKVSVSGGTVTKVISSHVTPTLGHVHLYLNNQLIYMSYTLQQEIPVHPGLEYTMYAEFVAQDHFPFYPRDVTPTVYFSIAAT
jgi:hypothetical protein